MRRRCFKRLAEKRGESKAIQVFLYRFAHFQAFGANDAHFTGLHDAGMRPILGAFAANRYEMRQAVQCLAFAIMILQDGVQH
jgi:hypothetical protein